MNEATSSTPKPSEPRNLPQPLPNLRDIDEHFAQLIKRIDPSANQAVLGAAARVSRALGSFVEQADWLKGAAAPQAEVEQLDQKNRQAG